MNQTGSIPLEELANGYCLAVGNAYRLIEDAERLFEARRLMGGMASLKAAVVELGKVHLITRAVTFDEADSGAWAGFRDQLKNPDALLSFLKNEIHENIYRSRADTDRTRWIPAALIRDFTGLQLGDQSGIFEPPGHGGFDGRDEKTASRDVYEYALALCKALNIHGMPDPVSQFKLFAHLRGAARRPASHP